METPCEETMEIGLLWRDGREGDLAEKVCEAASAHKQKYGKEANCCHVHPKMLTEAGGISSAGKVILVGDPYVLPGELWIGIAEDEECPDGLAQGPAEASSSSTAGGRSGA